MADAMNNPRKTACFGNANVTYYIDSVSGMIGRAMMTELPDGDIFDVTKINGSIVAADAEGYLFRRIPAHSRPA